MADEKAETVATERTPVDLLMPETCPPALKKFYNDVDRQKISEAVKSGSIVREVRAVKVKKGKSGTGQDELWPFILYRAVDGPGMAVLSSGKVKAKTDLPENFKDLAKSEQETAKLAAEDGACDYFNYGYSLTITQPIRTMLNSQIGGVDKQIEKQVKQMMKTGLFPSEEAAKSAVISQRKNIGLSVPDAFADDDDDEA